MKATKLRGYFPGAGEMILVSRRGPTPRMDTMENIKTVEYIPLMHELKSEGRWERMREGMRGGERQRERKGRIFHLPNGRCSWD